METIVWPLAVVLLGIAFFIIFKEPIAGLITKITGISKKGVEIGPEQVRHDVEERKVAIEALMEVSNFPTLLQQEKAIRDMLQSKGLDITGDTVKVLIRHLSVQQMLLHFEITYAAIWGSQIQLLKLLQTNGPMKRADLDQYFATVKQGFPHIPQLSNWDTNQYVAYLIDQKLLRQESDLFAINDIGTDFLVWMVRFGKTENKGM